jgi:hypothetical protein
VFDYCIDEKQIPADSKEKLRKCVGRVKREEAERQKGRRAEGLPMDREEEIAAKRLPYIRSYMGKIPLRLGR